MKRIILFSAPLPDLVKKITPLLFPPEIDNKLLAYMPSDGADIISNQRYSPYWENLANAMDTKFNFINNSTSDLSEKEKLRESNILLITGGNTFTLLNNIKKNGLFDEILKMAEKDSFVIAGFSAGAAVLTPTINIVAQEWSYGVDDNNVGLRDLSGLSLINFEVLPHYTESDKTSLEEYSNQSEYEVKPIANEDYVLIEN